MFIRDILSQKRYLPVKLAIVAVIASFIAVLSFHISRSSGVSTFNGTVTNDTDIAGNTGSQKKMSYVSVTIQQNDSLWSIAKKYKNQYDVIFIDFSKMPRECHSYREYIDRIEENLIRDLYSCLTSGILFSIRILLKRKIKSNIFYF